MKRAGHSLTLGGVKRQDIASRMSAGVKVALLEKKFNIFRTEVFIKLELLRKFMVNRHAQVTHQRSLMDKELDIVEVFLDVFDNSVMSNYTEDKDDPDYMSDDNVTAQSIESINRNKKRHLPKKKLRTAVRRSKRSSVKTLKASIPSDFDQNINQNGKMDTVPDLEQDSIMESVVPCAEAEIEIKIEASDYNNAGYYDSYSDPEAHFDDVETDEPEPDCIAEYGCVDRSISNHETLTDYDETGNFENPKESDSESPDLTSKIIEGTKPERKRKLTGHRTSGKPPSGIYEEYVPYRTTSESALTLWTHFLRETTGHSAICKTCRKVIKVYGGTTALWRHLRRKSCHSVNLNVLPEENAKTDIDYTGDFSANESLGHDHNEHDLDDQNFLNASKEMPLVIERIDPGDTSANVFNGIQN